MTDNYKALMAKAVIEIDNLQAKVDALEKEKKEQTAVIGMACRFPGNAVNPELFWKSLRDGECSVTEVPSDRWSADKYYDPDPDKPGKIYCRHGAFLNGIDQFDAGLFGISPREADHMDPQQRILLEVSWEAIERAGISASNLNESRTGVFIGIATRDYEHFACDMEKIDLYTGTGTAASFMSGRLSYTFGLQGPSVVVDTACSSSLVAVHQACRSLCAGECNLALAGGVNLMLTPYNTYLECRGKMLSPSGLCRSFDARADGYIRGEGCAVLVLKRLSAAIRDNDNILAVIRGSAVNHDGRSSGPTVPNEIAQKRLLRDALAKANISPHQVSYIEAHGTGTALGDPIELGALGEIFNDTEHRTSPLLIGSVKTNIGHLEAAGGVAGMAKVILAMQNEEIPAHLHFSKPNPHVPWDDLFVKVTTDAMAWKHNEHPRIAGISSFGFSGTNAHIILEEGPPPKPDLNIIDRPSHVICLSAKNKTALKTLSKHYTDFLSQYPEVNIGDLCYTANTGRVHFPHRLCVIGDSIERINTVLSCHVQEQASPDIYTAEIQTGRKQRISFLFPGDRAQMVGFAKQLYETQPLFRDLLDRREEIFKETFGCSLLHSIYPQTSYTELAEMPHFSEGACFVLETALCDLWRSWKVVPYAVMGIGIGVYAAAYAAGVFDLKTGLNLILKRCHHETFFSQPQIVLISAATGRKITDDATQPIYWQDQCKQAAGIDQAIKTLYAEGCTTFLTMGSDVKPNEFRNLNLDKKQDLWLTGLGSRKGDWRSILVSLAELHLRGFSIDWAGLDHGRERHKVILPTYPFQHRRHWLNNGSHRFQIMTTGQEETKKHPLLGGKVTMASGQVLFQSEIRIDGRHFLSDHKVFGIPVMPGTGFIEMAVAAAHSHFGTDRILLTEMDIVQAMQLPEDNPIPLQLLLSPEEPDIYKFQIFSQSEEKRWTLHARGSLAVNETVPPDRSDFVPMQTWTETPVMDIYQRLHNRGFHYGPCFQGLERLRSNCDQFIGHIRLPQPLIPEFSKFTLHPALLDACFQILGAGLFQDDNSDELYLLVGIDRLKLHGTVDTRVVSYGYITADNEPNKRTVKADLQIFSADGNPVITVHGLRLQRTGLSALTQKTQNKNLADWLYSVHWKPLARWNELPADYFPTPFSLQASVNSESDVPQFYRTDDYLHHQSLLDRLESLSICYVVEAFMQLGWSFERGDRFTICELMQKFGILDVYERLLGRLLEMLFEETFVVHTSGVWEVIQTPERVDPSARLSLIRGDFTGYEDELNLFSRCAGALSLVLKGETDPLQLLFPDGDTSEVNRMYEASPASKLMNNLVRRTLCEALAALPVGRGARIIEVGAGTGSTTSAVLDHLPQDQIRYLFSDISAMFTTRARHKFKHFPFMQYGLLDIEKDPEGQVPDVGLWDIVLAANVLHATQDLDVTLHNVKKLLKPGGLLVLLEGTSKFRWIDLIFGLTDGWWRFTDTHRRPCHPLMPVDSWTETLKSCGFEEPVHIGYQNQRFLSPTRQAIIVARKACYSSVSLAQADQWIIYAANHDLGKGLAERLRKHGESSTLVFPAEKYSAAANGVFYINPAEPSDFRRFFKKLSKEDGKKIKGVVHLAGLNISVSNTLTSKSLKHLSRNVCGSALHLIQALIAENETQRPRVWLVTQGSQSHSPASKNCALVGGTLWGLGKVVALEHPELNCVCLDLDPEVTGEKCVDLLFEDLMTNDGEEQIVYRRNVRQVARFTRHKGVFDTPVRLNFKKRGGLEHLLLENAHRRCPNSGEVEIQVHAAGLNFIDVLDTLGMLPFERKHGLGNECSGIVTSLGPGVDGLRVGDKVIAVAPGSMASYVTVPAVMTVPMPTNMSFEEGASVPVNYLTAYYALHLHGKMAEGEKVLIHAAAGGTGMAAVALALSSGVEVFATASVEKWDVLREMGVTHVMNSRNLHFAEEILEKTGGIGVDLVLNSLNGEFIPKSLTILKKGGRFIEIGKIDAWSADRVAQYRPDVSYIRLDLLSTFERNPTDAGKMLQRLTSLFENRQLPPPKFKTFTMANAISAFRHMQGAKHIGKIVLLPEKKNHNSASTNNILFRKDACYLITGAFGGLGPLLTDWMVKHGARHLLLLTRSDLDNHCREHVQRIEQKGARIEVLRADVSNLAQMRQAIEHGKKDRPPLRGAIHCVGVLDDGVLRHQRWERFAKVLAPKVEGAWHLHQITQHMDLDFLIFFSSAASLIGSPGQANHAAANAFLDTLAYYRNAVGLPAMSINWGVWLEAGAAAQRDVSRRIALKGLSGMVPEEGLTILGRLLESPSPQVGVLPIDWSLLRNQILDRPFFEDFSKVEEAADIKAESTEFLSTLTRSSYERRRELLISHICHQIANILGFDSAEDIDDKVGFFDLGMDSLTAVELRNSLQTGLNCALPATLLFDYPSVSSLADYLVEKILIQPSVQSDSRVAAENSDIWSNAMCDLPDISEEQLGRLLDEQIMKAEQKTKVFK